MIRLADKRFCVGCANCLQVCPQQCIRFSRDAEGFCYPVVEEQLCINCGKCNEVCPVEVTIPLPDNLEEPIAFGAFYKDQNIRMNSSSGGAFSAFADDTLRMNGVVFGAAFFVGNIVRHTAIHSATDLSRLRGSKYVQSDIDGVFPAIGKLLHNGVPVLFSGTPCQVKALYAYFGARPNNLLTIDVICHGVPSPLVFEKYMREEKGCVVNFRKKDRGWQNYDIEITQSNGRIKRQRAAQNPYMRSFLQNWILRPSCSRCPAKGFTCGSDVTLGDFWGVAKYAPGLFDDKGTSLVIIHTKKGKCAWSAIKHELQYAEVPLDCAVRSNRSLLHSAVFPENRDSFFKNLESASVKATLVKFAGEHAPEVLKRHLLTIWNVGMDVLLGLRNLTLKCYDFLCASVYRHPDITDIENSLLRILRSGCSVCRFGDGELKLLQGGQTWFQESHPLLQQRLKEILLNHNPTLLVCAPNIFGSLSNYTESDRRYWLLHVARNRKTWLRFMDRNQTYYDAFISRCYLPYKDKTKASLYFNLWKQIWDGRDLLVVEGEKTRLGVGNDLFANTHSIKRILCPNTQAFSHYENLMASVLCYDHHYLVLIALGPTATVMAADLCTRGYQAIDIGHLDIEYEWFLRGAEGKVPIPGKFVNEAGAGLGVKDCDDEAYLREIVCRC